MSEGKKKRKRDVQLNEYYLEGQKEEAERFGESEKCLGERRKVRKMVC